MDSPKLIVAGVRGRRDADDCEFFIGDHGHSLREASDHFKTYSGRAPPFGENFQKLAGLLGMSGAMDFRDSRFIESAFIGARMVVQFKIPFGSSRSKGGGQIMVKSQ